MTKQEFIEAMQDYAKKFGEAITEQINRTDKQYTGLTIRKVGVPTPVINLDKLYAEYDNEDRTMEECYGVIDNILNMKSEYDTSRIMEWNKAKERLFLRVFGKIMDDVLYQTVADLYLVPYIQVDDAGTAFVKVTSQLLNHWEVDKGTVFEAARENQSKIRPAIIVGLGEKLGIPDDTLPAYIVTTPTGNCGASAIFYEGIVDKVRELMDEDFYILPSSIHEVLVLPKSWGKDIDQLVDMVTTINANEVEEEERLSNSVYTYDFDSREFKKVNA